MFILYQHFLHLLSNFLNLLSFKEIVNKKKRIYDTPLEKVMEGADPEILYSMLGQKHFKSNIFSA